MQKQITSDCGACGGPLKDEAVAYYDSDNNSPRAVCMKCHQDHQQWYVTDGVNEVVIVTKLAYTDTIKVGQTFIVERTERIKNIEPKSHDSILIQLRRI